MTTQTECRWGRAPAEMAGAALAERLRAARGEGPPLEAVQRERDGQLSLLGQAAE